jgi:thiamine pyrophosphate-dependent acetolactate synthase large subunit-like protein
MSTVTTGRLVARVLRAAGIDAVYGRPLPDVDVVDVRDDRVASLMATAHQRVHGRTAAVHAGGGDLVVGAARTSVPSEVAVVEDLLGAVQVLASGAARLRIDLDLGAPAPDVTPARPVPPDRWREPGDDLLDAVRGAERPVVLAGPGVVAGGAVPGLHALAAAGSLGVLNTWGAKGVFDWRSRHHLATAGLQEHDFALAGLGDADLILATGVDPDEAPAPLWTGLAPVAEVAPSALDPLAERWGRPPAEIPMPALRTELARVTQEGWNASSTPLAPPLVTRHYAQALGAGGLVAADPGLAGYWVARTFATTDLGGVQVPAAAGTVGFAVACAMVARLRSPFRPVLAVVDGPLPREPGGLAEAAREAAARLGIAVPLAVWDGDGPRLTVEEHVARLQVAVVAETPEPIVLATDPSHLDRMVAAAGEVVAWGGLTALAV